MKVGKLTNQQLKKIVLQKLKTHEDVLLSSKIGEDCAALDFSGEACVLSTDPITGTGSRVGTLAVLISANDVASSGARPTAMLATLLVPPCKTMADIQRVADEMIAAADRLDISIIGGHTEVTDAVNRIVVSTTVIGRIPARELVTSSGANPGDSLIMTKQAALEGTNILAGDRKKELRSVLSAHEIKQADDLIHQLSVVEEGVIAGRLGATAMHDVTEGGVLGAVHELCEASGTGCEIMQDDIPVMDITEKICAHFSISPYRLIGSGSMLITTPDPDKMLAELKAAGVSAAQIGRITKSGVFVVSDGKKRKILPPKADALFSV